MYFIYTNNHLRRSSSHFHTNLSKIEKISGLIPHNEWKLADVLLGTPGANKLLHFFALKNK